MINPHAEAENAPLNKYTATGRVASERSDASFAPRIGLIAAAAMNPAEARLCAANNTQVILRACFEKSVMNLSS
jgi:hypothetical protein